MDAYESYFLPSPYFNGQIILPRISPLSFPFQNFALFKLEVNPNYRVLRKVPVLESFSCTSRSIRCTFQNLFSLPPLNLSSTFLPNRIPPRFSSHAFRIRDFFQCFLPNLNQTLSFLVSPKKLLIFFALFTMQLYGNVQI